MSRESIWLDYFAVEQRQLFRRTGRSLRDEIRSQPRVEPRQFRPDQWWFVFGIFQLFLVSTVSSMGICKGTVLKATSVSTAMTQTTLITGLCALLAAEWSMSMVALLHAPEQTTTCVHVVGCATKYFGMGRTTNCSSAMIRPTALYAILHLLNVSFCILNFLKHYLNLGVQGHCTGCGAPLGRCWNCAAIGCSKGWVQPSNPDLPRIQHDGHIHSE